MTVGDRLSVVLQTRIPKLVERYLNYFLLWCGLLLLGFKRITSYIKTNPGFCIVTIGLLLFVIPNLTSGFMLTEYFIPFLYLLIPIVGVLFEKLDSNHPRYQAIFLRLILGGALISGLIWHSTSYIDLSGDRLPIEEIREAASVVKVNSTPEDVIYVLEALTVVVEADRQAMPGMTMAQFSLFDGDVKATEQLHLVNGPMTLEYFDLGTPKIVILTSFDWARLHETTESDEIEASLKKHYQLIYTASEFGQNMNRIEVYLLRAEL